MRCERCHKREAMIQVSISQNNQKNELFLCDTCAHELLQNNNDTKHQHHHSLNKFILKSQSEVKTCPTCGSTLQSIRDNGLFGCGDCYKTFSEEANQIINRAQLLKDSHTGKVPGSYEKCLKQEEKIEALEKKLEKLVKAQEFEEAAIIRDEIKVLKEDGNDEDESLAEK